MLERFSTRRPCRSPLSPRDDRALRAACDYLAERSERNVGLDERAAAAGIGKFRLVRLFRERTGLPPTLSTSPTASVPHDAYSRNLVETMTSLRDPPR